MEKKQKSNAFIITAAIDRYDRSRDRSIESIDSIDSIILRFFQFFWHVGELEICLVWKFQLRTTLGGRKNAEKRRKAPNISEQMPKISEKTPKKAREQRKKYTEKRRKNTEKPKWKNLDFLLSSIGSIR